MTIKGRPGAPRVSPALGAGKDPRARQSGTAEVEFPLVFEGGKIKLVLAGNSPLAVDPQRGLYERVADGVEVTSASPYATRLALGAGLMLVNGRVKPRLSRTIRINAQKQIVAVVSTEDVTDPDDVTLSAKLGRIENELTATEAALDARIDVLEAFRPKMRVTFHAVASAQTQQTNLLAADRLFFEQHRHVQLADLTGYTEVRLLLNKQGTAGSAGTKLALRYAAAYSTTVDGSGYAIIGTSAVEVAADTANTYEKSAWTPLVAGATGDCYLGVIQYGGDGAADPQFGSVVAEFRR